MYSEICSMHLTHPWGAVGSHSTAPGDQLQILSQYLGQGYWLEIDTIHVLTVGKRAPVENPRRHGKNMQTSHGKVLPQLGIEPWIFLLWGDNANHYATMPP